MGAVRALLHLAVVGTAAAFAPGHTGRGIHIGSWRAATAVPAQHAGVRGATCALAHSPARRRVLGLVSAFATALVTEPLRSVLAEGDADAIEEYANEKMNYRIEHQADFKKSNKPVKTHLDEIQFKTGGGTEVGITVDPVKIGSISEFGTPKQVAKRVLDTEKGRDGVTSAKVLAYGNDTVDGVAYYTIEYQSSSSRGDKHFISKVTIVDKKLYVLTAVAKKDKFEDDEEALRAAVDSFAVGSPK